MPKGKPYHEKPTKSAEKKETKKSPPKPTPQGRGGRKIAV